MTDGGRLAKHLRRVFERQSADAHGVYRETDWGAFISRYEAEAAPMRRRRSFLQTIFAFALRS